MRIGLAYDLQTDPSASAQAEFDPPETLEAIAAALRDAGHAVVPLGGARDLLCWFPAKRLPAVDLVMNLAEGAGSRCREAWAPTLLEVIGVPYTGSDPVALAAALDKVATKRLCVAAGIPTPRWMTVEPGAPCAWPASLRPPLIVKPRYEGSAVGIDPAAIVRDAAALQARVRWVTETFRQPALIEEFIAGGEATVCLIGNDPPEALPPILRPIDPISGLAWHASRATAAAQATVPVDLTPPLERALQQAAVAVFELLGCRDVARVDFRIDAQGRWYVLEINPLPNWSPTDSFGLLGESLGIGHAGMIRRLVVAAAARCGLPCAGVSAPCHASPS